MKSKILNRIIEIPLVDKFMSTPSPRWVVFMVDLLIAAFSCAITLAANPDFGTAGFGWWSTMPVRFMVTMLIYLTTMLIVRPHYYIVRLSVVEDIYRVVAMVTAASVVMGFVSAACYVFRGVFYFKIWNIFVIGLLNFTIMMLVRMAIKYFYRQAVGAGIKRRRVIAMGSAINSFAYASALNNEVDSKYKVVAMISVSSDVKAGSINGIPLLQFSPDTIDDIFSNFGCDTLIFPSTQLKFMRSGVADMFLKHGIKLLMYSTVNKFKDEHSGQSQAGSVRDIHIEDLLGRDVIKTDNHDVVKAITGQVVMITGSAGSIGSEIVNQVAEMKASDIVLVDQAETPMHELQLFMEANHPDIKIHLFMGDVANKDRMEQAFKHYRPRFVFHAAAYKHVPMMERNPSEAIITNVLGTKNIADLSVKYRVEKFVMISTDKAVNPTNVMGASKRIAEIYVQSLFFHLNSQSDQKSTRFITTRFGNVLGSNGSVIPLFRKQIEQGGPVTVTHRDIIRYFMTIPEACSLVLQAGTMGQGGEIYVFDMGQPVKIYDLATRMISLSGLKVGEDIEIIETGLRPGEKLYEELLNDKEYTLPTSNDKIMIAKVRTYDYKEVREHINRLLELTQRGEYHDIVAEMKRMVPEYKSKNSMWESIDKEITTKEVITEINTEVK